MTLRATENSKPLCVDLDGTLLATDTLLESLVILLKTAPLGFWAVLFWIFRGKAIFKRQLVRHVVLNPEYLPYRKDVLSFLKEQQRSGRKLILVTAADQQVAENIANYLKIFSSIIASNGKVNLSGRRKLSALQKNFGHKGFDYMGNASVDLAVWQAARRAILVHPSSRLVKRVRRISSVYRIFSPRTNPIPILVNALRVNQWVKNTLLFVPLLMAHKMAEIELVIQTIIAFFSFSLCASSVYILNDILDLGFDRQHPTKKFRPFAAGLLPIKTGIFLIPFLIVSSFTIAIVYLPINYIILLAFYYLLTTIYSFYLKRILIVDVLVLAALYTLRVLSGAVAVNIYVSPWLLAFSMFIFLSLAFLKRYSELLIMKGNKVSRSKGRGYTLKDIELFRSIGPTTGYLAILVLVLYINSNQVVKLYNHPMLLWLIGPLLLYWVTRMWFLAHRGEMLDDPIVFTVKDRNSYAVGCLVAFIIIVASI
ncbi:MAG: UbiA family prenyltransferase [bacterium]